MSRLEEFKKFREKMNEIILRDGNTDTKRFFALDGAVYRKGALDIKTKEMLGLVSSLVLRCDDCISYHVIRCKEEGVTLDEFYEIFNVGLIVGGSIVIPHFRRAVALIEELQENQ